MSVPLFTVYEPINGESRVHEHPALKLTDAERAAGVTPVNYAYPPGQVERYGTNTVPGTTSMRAAWQAAIDVAKRCGCEITWNPGPHLIDGTLDCTMAVGGDGFGFTFRGRSQINAKTFPPNTYAPDVIFRTTGHGFDCTGTNGIFFRNMSIGTDTTTYPDVLFLMARNTDGRSMICHWDTVMVLGKFSIAAYYLYGCENSAMVNCEIENLASDSGAKCVILTGNNIRSLTSSFTTIATGIQSAICYDFFGVDMLMQSTDTSADCIELEQVRYGQFWGGWLCCLGRSLVHVNTTHAFSDGWSFYGVLGEASVPPPSYGVHFGTEHAAGSYSGTDWNFFSCRFPHATALIGGGQAGFSLYGLVLGGLNSGGLGTGGVNITGTLQSPIEAGSTEGVITATSIVSSNFRKLNGWQQNDSGETNHTMKDASAASNEKGYRLRSVGGQFIISALNDSDVVSANPILIDRNGTTVTLIELNASAYSLVNLPGSYANDAAAAAGGVAVGSLYRNGSAVQIRVV